MLKSHCQLENSINNEKMMLSYNFNIYIEYVMLIVLFWTKFRFFLRLKGYAPLIKNVIITTYVLDYVLIFD